jgi:hypothetical protein
MREYAVTTPSSVRGTVSFEKMSRIVCRKPVGDVDTGSV